MTKKNRIGSNFDGNKRIETIQTMCSVWRIDRVHLPVYMSTMSADVRCRLTTVSLSRWKNDYMIKWRVTRPSDVTWSVYFQKRHEPIITIATTHKRIQRIDVTVCKMWIQNILNSSKWLAFSTWEVIYFWDESKEFSSFAFCLEKMLLGIFVSFFSSFFFSLN